MGAKNVTAAFAMYPDLPHRAFRLLTYMALITLDESRAGAEARVSWIGRDALAQAIGFDVPAEPEPYDERPEASAARAARHSAFMALGAALRTLTDAGAVERRRTGRRNSTAEYVLHVDPLAKRQRSVVPARQRNVVTRDNATLSTGQRGVIPEEDRGTTEENRGGQPLLGQPPHVAESKPVDNDEDSSIRRALERLGPERQQRYLDAAHREGMSPTTSALIRRAAQLARVVP